jgi:F0F1-type ATP synthase assembly protein I
MLMKKGDFIWALIMIAMIGFIAGAGIVVRNSIIGVY